MAHFIDKAALVAEIEKLKLCTMDEHMNYYSTEAQGEYNALSKLESFIDTIEVKEVDLEKAIENYLSTYWTEEKELHPFLGHMAKHFFELGLKAQKVE